MKAVQFPEANIQLAESQEEYETLPIWMDLDEDKQPTMTMMADAGGNLSMQRRDPYGEAAYCMELTDEEVEEIVRTRKIWGVQSTFWNSFQPIRMSTQNPFNQPNLTK